MNYYISAYYTNNNLSEYHILITLFCPQYKRKESYICKGGPCYYLI